MTRHPCEDTHRILHCAILATLAVAGCGDAPSEPALEEMLAAAVVSDPADHHDGTTVAWVSLPRGSITITGLGDATIRNRRTDDAVLVTVAEGGFDPVAVPAKAKDRLEIVIPLSWDDTPLAYELVVPATCRPEVIRTAPLPYQADVPVQDTLVVVFSEPMDSASLARGGIELTAGTGAVAGTITFADASHLIARFAPATLAGATAHQLTVGAAARDLDGESVERTVTVDFTTGPPLPTGWIAFVRSGDLLAMWPDASVVRTLKVGTSPRDLAWSPDGGRLAAGYWNGIVVFHADGTGATTLTALGADGLSWSPDGRHLAFHSAPTDSTGTTNTDVYLVEVAGGSVTRLTTDPAPDREPTWGPDGTTVAFTSERAGNPDIYVVGIDGTGEIRLTTDTTPDYQPAWSPDGDHIAFVRAIVTLVGESERQRDEIWVMRADGSAPVRLTPDGSNEGQPRWSPDGAYILFMHGPQIWVMNADGTARTQLSPSWVTHQDYQPTWSPDSHYIAFGSKRDGIGVQLYVMDRGGLGVTRLTDYPEGISNWALSWGPGTR